MIDKLLFCRSKTMRLSNLSAIVLFLTAGPVLAGPLLDDDLATCRERQGDPKERHDACERLIADGKAIGKVVIEVT